MTAATTITVRQTRRTPSGNVMRHRVTHTMTEQQRIDVLAAYWVDRQRGATRATARHWAIDFLHSIDDVSARVVDIRTGVSA